VHSVLVCRPTGATLAVIVSSLDVYLIERTNVIFRYFPDFFRLRSLEVNPLRLLLLPCKLYSDGPGELLFSN